MIKNKQPLTIKRIDVNYINQLQCLINDIIENDARFGLFNVEYTSIMESNEVPIYVVVLNNLNKEYYPLFFTCKEKLYFIKPDKYLHESTVKNAVKSYDTISYCDIVAVKESAESFFNMNTVDILYDYLLKQDTCKSHCGDKIIAIYPFTEIEEKTKPISPFTCFDSTEEYLTSVWRKVSL